MATLTAAESMQFLADAGKVLAESLDYESTLAAVSALVIPRFADWSTIHLLDGDGEVRRVTVTHSDPDRVRLAQEFYDRHPFRKDTPFGVAQVLRTGVPELIVDSSRLPLDKVTADPRMVEIIKSLSFVSSIVVPLRARGRILGALTLLMAESGRRYDGEDVLLAEELCQRIALAVDNARLFQETRRQAEELRRADKEIRRTQALMETALGMSDVAVSVIDPTGRIYFGNDAQARMVDFPTSAEMLAASRESLMQSVEFLHEDGSPIKPGEFAFASALQGIPVRQRIMRVRSRRNGEERWYEVQASPIRDESGIIRMVVTNSHDITRLQKSQEALRKGENLYRAVTENIPQLIWMADAEGKFVFYNRQWSEYTGRLIRAGESGSHLDLIHPEDLPGIMEKRQRTLANPAPCDLEYRVRRADGDWRWHLVRVVPVTDDRGRLECWFGSATDVHDLRLVEDSLRKSEEEFRAMFELAGAGTFLADTATGRLLRVNRMFCAISGRSEGALLGLSLADLVYGEDLPIAEVQLGEVRRGPSKEWHLELRIAREDGTLRWVQVSGTVLSRQGAGADRLLATVHDVTERKLAEEQAREAQEKFRQAQKLESIGRLAGGVAHDFNNLLTAINGYADLLLEVVDPESHAASFAREIRQSGDRAASLTRQLLAYSRRQIMTPMVTDLNGIVLRQSNMLGRLIGEEISLTAELEPGLAQVRVDPGQVEQVILNLAVNARDAMPDGGRLVIRTSSRVLNHPEEAHEAKVPPGRYVSLELRDTGQGMDTEVLARLFEPFFTTKEVGKGTGLGLSMVQGIVRQSGGYIQVESAPKRGARFVILFPAVEAHAAEIPPPEQAGRPAVGPREGTTVLLVEDEPSVRGYAREILTGSGYRVMEASSGIDAARLAETHAGEIHLLVSDVVMPGMTGPRLAENLLAARPGLRVLFISGYSDASIIRYGILGEGGNFLQKPFSPSDLLTKAREAMAQPAS